MVETVHDDHPFADFVILTKDGRSIPLEPNSQQLAILEAAASQQSRGLGVRLIILKGRQFGTSTIVEAIIFREVKDRPNVQGFVAAHDDDSSEMLFRMSNRFQDNLPKDQQRPTKYSSKKEIVFEPPHGSMMRVQTAGKINLGRSLTIQYLHISELAFWRNAEQSLLSVLQAVPALPGTMVVMESTANGMAGEFYERWVKAVKHRTSHPGDLSGYLPLFFSWLDFPEYSAPLPAGYRLGELDEDERELVDLGAKPEQLYWRRMMIADQCGGDPEKFKQEYPATPEQAFLASGRPAIPMNIVQHHESLASEPERKVVLARDGSGKLIVRDARGTDECVWHVWEEPEDSADYTVFGDVAEGENSTRSDPRSEPDFSAGAVFHRIDKAFVATCVTRVDPDVWGEQLRMVAEWYNEAWASPEVNAVGQAALVPFKRPTHYNHLYRRQGMPEAVEDWKEKDLLGFKTTTANRDLMIDDWLAFNRPHPTRKLENQIEVYDPRVVAEERTFIRKKDGKREHEDGYHDDLLFAHFGCLQLHLLCPRGLHETPHAGVLSRPASLNAGYIGGYDVETEEEECLTTR
jgi:hypothetical protein